jgi:ATP-binding cassette subfamily B protein
MKATDENLLRRSSLFQFLPEEHFEKLRPILQEENYEFGDLLVRQGEPADAFYVLVSGRARVVKADQNGNEIVLATLKPGDSFGEAALSEGGTRSATVRCSTAVETLRLDRSDFLQLAEETPELKHYVEMTARHRSLHGFLYEFSNFGRLPVPALRGLVEKLTLIDYGWSQYFQAQLDDADLELLPVRVVAVHRDERSADARRERGVNRQAADQNQRRPD